LLYVPSHTARSLYRDLAAAGVPKTTPKGRLDFHAARVAFINFLIENGDVTPKELQELARHSSIDMSWNVYGRANEERARDAVENLSAIMEIEAESVPFVHRLAVGAERENATPVNTGGCALTKLAPALGLEHSPSWMKAPRFQVKSPRTRCSLPRCRYYLRNRVMVSPGIWGGPGALLRAASMHPPDLQLIIDAWGMLPDDVRKQMLTILRDFELLGQRDSA